MGVIEVIFGELPKLPEGLVQPKIVTGIEGLGRGQDLNRLRAFLAIGQETLGPEFFAAWGRPNGQPMAEHMSVYGPSGSGKTYFVAYVLTERARLRTCTSSRKC